MPTFELLITMHANERHAIEVKECLGLIPLAQEHCLAVLAPCLQVAGIFTVFDEADSDRL